jgi:hypothetical protein
MNPRNSAKIVEDFWTAVWKAGNPGTVDDFVVDDFVITTGGVDIKSKQKFKEWLSAFMEKISDLRFEVLETFQKCRWKLRCMEVAYHGEEQRPAGHPGRSEAVSFSGTAVRAVGADGKLYHNWVETQLL